MARRAAEVVVIVGAGLCLSAFGLQGDQGVIGADGGECEGPVPHQRVGLWRAECGGKVVLQAPGQAGQRGMVVGQRPCQTLCRQPFAKVLIRDAKDFAAGCQRVQPDGMGKLMRLAGIGGQDDGLARRPAQPVPRLDARDGQSDAVLVRGVDLAGKLQFRIA